MEGNERTCTDKDGDAGAGAVDGEGAGDPVTTCKSYRSQVENVLVSFGSPLNLKMAERPRLMQILPNAADGMPPKVSEFSEAGLQSNSPVSPASTCLSTQYRAALDVRLSIYTVAPASSTSRLTGGPRHLGALPWSAALKKTAESPTLTLVQVCDRLNASDRRSLPSAISFRVGPCAMTRNSHCGASRPDSVAS